MCIGKATRNIYFMHLCTKKYLSVYVKPILYLYIYILNKVHMLYHIHRESISHVLYLICKYVLGHMYIIIYIYDKYLFKYIFILNMFFL